jgi:hypothetical protein
VIIAGGSTGAWAATPYGWSRPPLPSDVDAVTEPLYIDRTAGPNYVNTDLNGTQVVHLHIIIEDYNPEWVFLDVRGVNFRITSGNIRHVCFGGIDLSDVAQMVIGIGNGNPVTTDGTVWFEDVQLYATRCALATRSDDFADLDFAPLGSPGGDCVVDDLEVEVIADNWLDADQVVATHNPGDTNLVVYYSMNEGHLTVEDGNKIYSRPDLDNPDVCDPRWVGWFWNNGATPPGYYGTTWATPGYDDTGNCVYLTGEPGSRIQCGDPCQWSHLGLGIGSGKVYPTDVNAMTLSVWVKWLGSRTWDAYLMSKCQGVLGKRGGWDDQSMVWMLELDTNGTNRTIGLRHYAVGDTATPDLYAANDLMSQYINQWVHIACTFPHPADDTAADANSHARIYLNGGEVADQPWRFSLGRDPNIYLSIGETQDQNAWPQGPESFYGYIDEVRIYNRALEPNEIGYLADMSPGDGLLWIPIPSAAEVYSTEIQGSKRINFKDFALVANRWLTEEMFPR